MTTKFVLKDGKAVEKKFNLVTVFTFIFNWVSVSALFWSWLYVVKHVMAYLDYSEPVTVFTVAVVLALQTMITYWFLKCEMKLEFLQDKTIHVQAEVTEVNK